MSTRSCSTVSTHNCTIPLPNGPGRNTVGGTTPNPDASEIKYVDTSRPASVPFGKSHSGRSPRTGLYTHCADIPSREIPQNSVAFDASTNRPSTSIRPRVNRSSTPSSPGSTTTSALLGTPVAVLPRTHVTLRVQRLRAQRTRLATRVHHPIGPLGERPRLRRRQEDPNRVRTLLRVVQHDRLVHLVLGDRQQLDDHRTG